MVVWKNLRWQRLFEQNLRTKLLQLMLLQLLLGLFFVSFSSFLFLLVWFLNTYK